MLAECDAVHRRAAPLQHDEGCRDCAKKMILQCHAEVDDERALVVLDLRAPFHCISRDTITGAVAEQDPVGGTQESISADFFGPRSCAIPCSEWC